MSNRSTLVAVVLALLGIAAVIVLRQRGPAAAPAATALGAAASLPVDQVQRITLERPGQGSMVFDRRGESWEQVEPFTQPMEAYSIRQLVNTAAQVEAQRIDPGKADLHDLELEGSGRATLRMSWGQGELVLRFGRRGVAGRWYVSTPADGAVYVAAGDLYDRAVEMDPKEWRDRALLSLDPAELDLIEIEQGPQPVKLERQGRAWMMVEPWRTRADEVARISLQSALGRAKSGGFIADQPDDLAPFGLAAPTARVTLRSPGGGSAPSEPRVERLLVGDRMSVDSEDRFGMIEGRPVVVRLPEALLRAIFPKALDLVSPTGCGVPAADVKSIIIRGSDGDLRLERDLERWVAPDRGGVEVPAKQANALLELLTTRRAEEVRPDPSRRFATTITLYGFDTKPRDTVRVDRDPDGRLVLENGDGILRLFPKDFAAPLTAAELGL